MVGLRIKNLVGKNINQIPKRTFHTYDGLHGHTYAHWQHRSDGWHVVARLLSLHLFQTPEEIGVWLDDVQVGVLRLRIVSIQLRQAHIGYLAPLACAGLYVAVVLTVKSVFLYAVV